MTIQEINFVMNMHVSSRVELIQNQIPSVLTHPSSVDNAIKFPRYFPHEIIFKIFELLLKEASLEEFRSLGSVCRDFHQVSSDERLWKPLIHRSLSNLTALPKAPILRDSYIQYQKLHNVFERALYCKGILALSDNLATQGMCASCPSVVYTKQFLIIKGAFSTHEGEHLFAYDARTRHLVWRKTAPQGKFYAVDDKLYAVMEVNRIAIISLSSGETLRTLTFENSQDSAFNIGLSNDTGRLWAYTKREIQCWNIKTGTELERRNYRGNAILILAMQKSKIFFASPHGRRNRNVNVQGLEDSNEEITKLIRIRGNGIIEDLYTSSNRLLFQHKHKIIIHSHGQTSMLRITDNDESDSYFTASCACGPFQFVGRADGKVFVIDMLCRQVIRTIHLEGIPFSLKFAQGMLIVSLADKILALDFSTALQAPRSLFFKGEGLNRHYQY
jgi:hypothetical protein